MKLIPKLPCFASNNMILIRIVVILLYLVSGNLKWFSSEMQLVDELTENTLLSFLPAWFGHDGTSYFLAIVQAAIAIALLSGIIFPVLGIIGAASAIFSSIITLILLPAAMSFSVVGLAMKEVVLAGAAIFILHYDYTSWFRNSQAAKH
ncbi:hypothetical protein MUU49_06195 [Scandinavium goeteborgense]|uniref:hypothetical protein n=1 Tax=Scandinavium goeteborgense TaxID=1851514 RepID=UPI002165DDF6|nr:hypothetical protein [Scandinavium goeteborgense]MCS2152174.1 hypothetical protein [Scandinavium goeteborgense]